MACYGEHGEHPKGAATAITRDNLRDNLWPELAKWQERSPFLRAKFQWTKERVFSKEHPKTWFFSARTWSKEADKRQQAVTLAGLHSKYLLFVIDESGGVPDSVMAAAEGGLMTAKEGHFLKIMQAGNPTHLEGPLYRAATSERDLWHLVRITGDPDDPKRSPRISVEAAREQIRIYGRSNPWVMVNVFGEFPPSSINALLGPNDVERAVGRALHEDVYSWSEKRLGIDVSRFGDDLTTIFPRQGLQAFKPVEMRFRRDEPVSVLIANRIMLAKSRWGSDQEFIDDTVGWAHGAIDVLRAAGYSPHPIRFEAPADDPRYRNKRSEMWLRMAEWVLKGGSLPECPKLVRDLTAVQYWYEGGKFILESKDQIKERTGGESTDYGDALALTFAFPEMPREGTIEFIRERTKKTRSDWDPFDENRI